MHRKYVIVCKVGGHVVVGRFRRESQARRAYVAYILLQLISSCPLEMLDQLGLQFQDDRALFLPVAQGIFNDNGGHPELTR